MRKLRKEKFVTAGGLKGLKVKRWLQNDVKVVEFMKTWSYHWMLGLVMRWQRCHLRVFTLERRRPAGDTTPILDCQCPEAPGTCLVYIRLNSGVSLSSRYWCSIKWLAGMQGDPGMLRARGQMSKLATRNYPALVSCVYCYRPLTLVIFRHGYFNWARQSSQDSARAVPQRYRGSYRPRTTYLFT